jgi:TP901 family phage tail tape measure protein
VATVDEITVKVRLDLGGSIKGVTSLGGAFTSLASIATKAFGGIIDLVSNVASSMMDISTEFVTDAVDAYQTYDDALALVGKTTGMTGDALDEFGKQIRELAKPIGSLTAANLLEVAQVAGQMGIKGAESIAEFSRQVGIGAVALDKFGGSTEKLALHMGKSQTIFKLAADSTANMLSALDAVSKSMNANELEISNFNKAMGQNNAVMRLSYEQATAWGGALISGGLAATSASRQMGSAYFNLTTKTDALAAAAKMLTAQSDGGTAAIARLEAITGKSRISFSSLGEMIQYALGQDSFNTMNLLTEAFNGLDMSVESIRAGVDQNTLATDAFGAIGLKAISTLAAAMDQTMPIGEGFLSIFKIAEDAFISANSHMDSYARQVDRASEAQKVLGSIWNSILITFGEPFAETFADFLKNYINPLVDKFEEWSRNSEKLHEVFGILHDKALELAGAVIGPLSEQFEVWMTYVEEHGATLWDSVEAGASKFWETLKGLGEQIKEVFVKYTTPDESGQTGLSKAFTTAKEIVTTLGPALTELIPKLTKVVDFAEKVGDAFGVAWDVIRPVLDGIAGGIEKARKITMPLFQAVVAGFELMGDSAYGFKEAYLDVFGTLGDSIRTIIDLLKNELAGAWEAVSEGMSRMVDKVGVAMTQLKDKIFGAKEEVKALGDEAYEHSVFPEMASWADKVVASVDGIGSSLQGVTSQAKTTGQAIGSSLATMLAGGGEYMAGGGLNIASALAGGGSYYGASGVGVLTMPTRSQYQPPQVQAQAATPAHTAPVTVVFEGNNIVDERSVEAFAKRITNAQRTQESRVVSTATRWGSR